MVKIGAVTEFSQQLDAYFFLALRVGNIQRQCPHSKVMARL
jgi:hypothetical protein